MKQRVERRALLRVGIGLGIGLTVRTPRLALAQEEKASVRPREGDFLVRVDDPSAKPLGPEDVQVGAQQLQAWAVDASDGTVRSGSRLNRILLVRLDPEKFSMETHGRAAEGVVAYTAICTHTGCEVVEWLADDLLLHCPCHFSKFDPKDGGRVVDGPAPRALPALPLKIVDGKLAVAKPFTSRVGFEPA